MIVGVVLTLFILVGAWIFGRFSPALPSNWQNGMFITDSDSGAQYFSIDGTLHPVRNSTSAQLLAEGTSLQRTSVGGSALADIPRGPEIGIPGAPDAVPAPDKLSNTGWAACPVGQDVHLTIGGRPDTSDPVNGSLVSHEDRIYLVTGGRRYEIAQDDLSRVRLAFNDWGSAVITDVSANWLDLFEEGERVSPWSYREASDEPVGMTGALSDAKPGSVVEVMDGQENRYYLVTGKNTLDTLTDFELGMYNVRVTDSNSPPAAPIRVSVADISDLTVSPESPGPSSWPKEVPTLTDPETIPCAILVEDNDGVRTEIAQAVAPEHAGVVIPGGGGALVRGTGGGAIGAVFVVTDLGQAFGLDGDPQDLVQRLGYQLTDVTDIPTAWIKLLPQGPTLSKEEAWASVPSGSMAADGTVVAAERQTVATVNGPFRREDGEESGGDPGQSEESGGEEESQCERGNPQYLPQQPSAYPLLGIERAQQISLGEGVKVAVVDSGVDTRNAHLTQVKGGQDFTNGSNALADDEGHGTAVAGIIAAQPVDGSGLVGVAPKAEILPVRVYQSTQDDKLVGPNIPMTAQGIRWAADQGAQVIVAALSTSVDDPSLSDAVRYAQDRGALVVASAGNRNTADEGDKADGVRYPAGYEGVLSVTAVTDAGLPTDAAIHGVHVGVAAPGQNVLVSWFNDGDCIIAPDSPSTSFSTAYVAGIAALVASAYPDESPEMWKWRIEVSALRPDIANHNELTGWGVVSPFDALTVTPDGQYQGPLVPGGVRTPEPAEAGRTPPQASEKPLLVRNEMALGITGAGALGVIILWLLRRGQDLRERRRA